jgi:hypothetical protein
MAYLKYFNNFYDKFSQMREMKEFKILEAYHKDRKIKIFKCSQMSD